MDAVCMRCDRWFYGERCPGCDGDTNSRFVRPPGWAKEDRDRYDAENDPLEIELRLARRIDQCGIHETD